MRQIVLLLALALLPACAAVRPWLHPDSAERPINHLSHTPHAEIQLSVAPATCVGPDGTAEVYVYVFVLDAPPRHVRVRLNHDERFAVDLTGAEVTVHFRAEPGIHLVEAFPGGLAPVSTSFTVYHCEPAPAPAP